MSCSSISALGLAALISTAQLSEAIFVAKLLQGKLLQLAKLICRSKPSYLLAAPDMYSLTYDLWDALIKSVVDAYSALAQSMEKTARGIRLSRSLVDELKLNEALEIAEGTYRFLLSIETHNDELGGFRISLLAIESLDDFEKRKEMAAKSYEVSTQDIKNFEAEHGLDLTDEIFGRLEEEYEMDVGSSEEEIIFELVVFDSEDTDNNARMNLLSPDDWGS